MVDLGLSGSGFCELKARYGFVSVDNFPAAADYTGLLCNRPDAAKQPRCLKRNAGTNDAKIPEIMVLFYQMPGFVLSRALFPSQKILT